MNESAGGGVFASTADYYARYRPPFPDALYEAITHRFALDGRGALLDLGTGTGQIALTLHDCFERVVAIDISDEMIATARALAAAQRAGSIAWRIAPAEAFASIDTGPFRLVTFGNALHWMDQPRVLVDCLAHLEPGGGVALINMPGLINIDDTAAEEAWAREAAAVIKRHTGGERRAGGGVYRPPRRTWPEELAAAGFTAIDEGSAEYQVRWSLDEVLGYLYSTSFANHAVLGAAAEAFEADLRTTLAPYAEAGVYPRRLRATWAFGHCP